MNEENKLRLSFIENLKAMMPGIEVNNLLRLESPYELKSLAELCDYEPLCFIIKNELRIMTL